MSWFTLKFNFKKSQLRDCVIFFLMGNFPKIWGRMGPKVSHLLLTILLGIFGVNEENKEQTIVHLRADDIQLA